MTKEEFLTTINVALDMVDSSENANLEPEGLSAYHARENLKELGRDIELFEKLNLHSADAVQVCMVMDAVEPVADILEAELTGSGLESLEEFRYRHRRLRRWIEERREAKEARSRQRPVNNGRLAPALA